MTKEADTQSSASTALKRVAVRAKTFSKLLIDHARIGYTFYRPRDGAMDGNLEKSCQRHDEIIEAIERGVVAPMVRLVFEHRELSRGNMEIFIAPPSLPSQVLERLGAETRDPKLRARMTAKA